MSTTKAAVTPSAGERTPASSAARASALAVGLPQLLGNQHLHTLLGARLLQAKLAVSRPQDCFEQEADRVAEQVMRMPDPAPAARVGTVQRRTADACVELHRSGDSVSDVPTVDAATEHSIQALSGRGNTLPESVRSFMEPRFCADFSAVRIHNDAPAHQLARAVSAQAFTVGRNVVFGAGHYAPDTDSGRRLLAHELTHTIQQGATPSHVARAPETQNAAPTASTKSPAGGAPSSRDPRAHLTEYTPVYLDFDSASQGAARAIELLLKHHIAQKNLDHFTLIIVTNRVSIYSTSGALKKDFELTAPPPDHGFFLGGQRDDVTRLVYDKSGKATLASVGHRNPKELPWVTQWSKMTAADEAALLPTGTVPVLIIAGRPAPAKDGKGHGPGGSSNAPSNTKGKKSGKLTVGLSGDEYYDKDIAPDAEPANSPAFPARITPVSSLEPLTGRTELTMNLTWAHGSRDAVGEVWNASTPVRFRWEVWNVTDLLESGAIEPKDLANAKRQAPRDKSAEVHDQYLKHERRARAREFYEQAQNSRRAIASGGTAGRPASERSAEVWMERMNVALEDVSKLRQAGGYLVDAFWHEATKRDDQINLTWDLEGKYLVRCIASPQEHGGRRYASSVATSFVEVRPAAYIAKNTLYAADDEINQREIERLLTNDPQRIKTLDSEIATLEIGAHGSAVEALGLLLTRKQAELKTASARERGKLQDEVDSLETQLEIAKKHEKNLPPGPDGKILQHAYRPQAAIASDVVKRTFPLYLQLVPFPPFNKGDLPYWVIYDVTGKGDYLGHPYIGEAPTDGEAIEGAFRAFAAANEYGPGELVMHIPEAIPNIAKRDLGERNVNRGEGLAKERLHDLETVLMTVSIAVPALGEAALILGGVMAAQHIAERSRNGTLAFDDALVTDLLAVLGTVGNIAAKVMDLVVLEAGDMYAIAVRSGNKTAIEDALKGVNRAKMIARGVAIGNQLIAYGGLAWGEKLALDGIRKINDAERSGAMTHTEASSARSRAVLSAIQTNAMMFTGLIHQPRGHTEAGESTPHEESHTQPDERSTSGSEQEGSNTAKKTIGGTGGKPPHDPMTSEFPQLPREGPNAPERLFEMLERGMDPNLKHASPTRKLAKGEHDPGPSGDFRTGLTSPKEAYDAYNEALALSRGREVGIFYDIATGEYAVRIGHDTGVESAEGHWWIALVHFHPNRAQALVYRLPAPRDFKGRLDTRYFREGLLTREFVEYDMPGGGRGRTEYGFDPAFPKKPLYVRITHPDGTVEQPHRFSGFDEYTEYWGGRTRYAEPGSPEHEEIIAPARASGQSPTDSAAGGGRDGGRAKKSIAGPADPDNAKPEVADPSTATGHQERRTRHTEITQPYPIIEQIGEYTFSSQKWDDGKTVYWRIWNWSRVGGPKTDKIDFGPLRFIREVIARAKKTRCQTLELTVENITAESVERTGRKEKTIWTHFKATSVTPIADKTIRVVIPLGEAPAAATSEQATHK